MLTRVYDVREQNSIEHFAVDADTFVWFNIRFADRYTGESAKII